MADDTPRRPAAALADEAADRDAIVHHLSTWLPAAAWGAEIVVLYFAGHGTVRAVGKKDEGFLLPHDADPDNPAARGVAMSDVVQWVEGLDDAAVVVCLDCCHASKALPGREQGQAGISRSRVTVSPAAGRT
jgi:uncharacterized caspase-like protein